MREPHTLALFDDDGPTMVDPRSARARSYSKAAKFRWSRRSARYLVGSGAAAALLACAAIAHREHRRASRLSTELTSLRSVAAICVGPSVNAADRGAVRAPGSDHPSTTSYATETGHTLSAEDRARLEAKAAHHVVLGDYRGALLQYRVLADASPRSSVFADLVSVLEDQIGCIESGEHGESRCD